MDLFKIHMLASAIIKLKVGNASEEERHLLLEWLDENPNNRRTYKEIICGIPIRERIIIEDSIEQSMDYEELKNTIIHAIANGKSRRRRRTASFISYTAAAVIVVAALISAVNFGIFTSGNNDVLSENISSRVELTLHTGERYDMDKIGSTVTELIAQTSLPSQEKQVGGHGIADVKVPMNSLKTFRDGYSSFVLDDGTIVWINSVSELSFPSSFEGNERVVYLKGEASFEVAHDPERPFIVNTQNVAVLALGTYFNVQAYSDENEVCTTLLAGKVEVKSVTGGESVILTPGMQSTWNKSTNTLSSDNAKNLFDAMAWHDGFFIFNEKPLAIVTRMLSRWYDVDFIYSPEHNGQHTLSGRINKSDSLDATLEMITATGGPSFEIDGRQVYIVEK